MACTGQTCASRSAANASLDSLLDRRKLGVGTEETMAVTIKDLEAFAEGWNRHDVDFLMTFMADDCVFETSSGPEAAGKRYVGRERVREGFAAVFRRFPDVHFNNARHFVSGDRGLSEWLFTATTSDGKKIEVTGCDVFTFKGDKIAVKNSYLKNRTA
jgi:ketosteroid isomerase-like protein